MILSNDGIKTALREGGIVIDPQPLDSRYTTSAVDLTLSDDFRVWNERALTATGATTQIDLSKWDYISVANGFLEKATTDANGCMEIAPYRKRQSHYLAQTREWVKLSRKHRIAARVEGKSSLARIGLVVHLTAPIIHCGFEGYITLEIINFGPFNVKLVPKDTKICQLVFEMVDQEPSIEPNTAFQGQTSSAGTH